MKCGINFKSWWCGALSCTSEDHCGQVVFHFELVYNSTCVMLNQSSDSPLTCCRFNGELQIAWYFPPTLLPETKRNPDLELVKGSDQPVRSNHRATLTGKPLSSRFSPKCFHLSCAWLIRHALMHRWTGVMGSLLGSFLLSMVARSFKGWESEHIYYFNILI